LIHCSHHIFSAGDFFMLRSFILAGAAATMLAASFAGANAQQPMQRVQIGILECRGGASVGFIVGSVTNLGCVLRTEGMPEDRYVATIRKVGLDLGMGRLRTGGAARAGRSLRQLRRRAGQRGDRRRSRRQRAGRRIEQFDRIAASQCARPGRPQHRSRAGKLGTPAGKIIRDAFAVFCEERSNEAIHSFFVAVDCFVALAMTG
jgi:hypothetical protein